MLFCFELARVVRDFISFTYYETQSVCVFVWVISVSLRVSYVYGTTLRRFIFRLICATICFIAHTCEHRGVRCKCVRGKYRMWSRFSTVCINWVVWRTRGWTDRPCEWQHQQHQQQQSIATNSSPLIICFGGYAIVSRFHFNKTLLFKYYRWIVVVVVVDVVVVNDQQTEWIKKQAKKERNEWKKRAEQNKYNVNKSSSNTIWTINK